MGTGDIKRIGSKVLLEPDTPLLVALQNSTI